MMSFATPLGVAFLCVILLVDVWLKTDIVLLCYCAKLIVLLCYCAKLIVLLC
jgi:hypothetical protein